jgi:Lactate dehydrogenase and related dehydrogenases
MERIAFFDTKPYDREHFDAVNTKYELVYFENKLNAQTARLAQGCSGVCAFVNDEINSETIAALHGLGVRLIAMRSAGYSNVDVKAAFGKVYIVRVPAYSPHAVAEHAMALLLTLNRKTHRAYSRTRDFNFSIVGLTGIDLYGKTVGVIGTGQIGRVFIDICKGFGMSVVAYDPYPAKNSDINYVDLDTLFSSSDIISLHCPLTEQTQHLVDKEAFEKIKPGAFIINTSRGALIESGALLDALNSGKIRGAGLDVYEEEADLFFEDYSGTIIKDDVLALLVSRPNVLLTSHQAFLTEEALANIAQTTLDNLDAFFADKPLDNEVCYKCKEGGEARKCLKERNKRCF